MSQIQISSNDVLGYSAQLKRKENEIIQIFGQVQKNMDRMSTYWNSPASKALFDQFHSLKSVFDNYVQTLDRYVVFLNQTAQIYQENETRLSQGVSV